MKSLTSRLSITLSIASILIASGLVAGESNSNNAAHETRSKKEPIAQGQDHSIANIATNSFFNLHSDLIYLENVPPDWLAEGVAGNSDFLAYATFGTGGPLFLLDLTELVADDILPITSPGLCQLSRYQARVAGMDGPFIMNTHIWSHDETNDRPMAPVLGTAAAQSGTGMGAPINIVTVLFDAAVPIEIPTPRFWLSYDVEGNRAGPLIGMPPQLGSSVDGFSIFGEPDSGVWSGPVWFFGGCPSNPCGIFHVHIYCASAEPGGACCTHTLDSEYSCQEGVPQSSCTGRFVQDLPCEFGFDPPCGAGACCFVNGTCDDIYESDCAGLGGVWHEDTFCSNSDSDSCDDVCADSCPNDPLKCSPGVCGCGVSDADTDSDGTPDCIDECDEDPNKVVPGVCGCGIIEDTGNNDNDSCINCLDACPSDYYKCSPGICGCGVDDTDRDSDGIPDCNDPIARIFLVEQDADPDPGVIPPAGENISLIADGGDVLRFEAWLEADPGFHMGAYQIGWHCSFGFSTAGSMSYNSICLGTDCSAFPSSPRVNRNQPFWAMSGLQTGSAQSQGMCPQLSPWTAMAHWIHPPYSNHITTPRYLAEIQYTVSMDAKGSTKLGVLSDTLTRLSEEPTDFRVPYLDDGVTITIRTGRCCIADGCLDDVTRRECESAGGTFRADATCSFDFDQDGTSDCDEECPFDPNKLEPGICGCGVSDADTDLDAVVDCIEECDTDPNKYFPGLCGCGVSDVDTDADTVPDCFDLCPGGDDTIDTDNDGHPDCGGAPIPTTTTWGLIAMTLLLLCGAQVMTRPVRHPSQEG